MVRVWKKTKNFVLFASYLGWENDKKKDGWLAPAIFLQEYKYFDQHLPTVKNETAV